MGLVSSEEYVRTSRQVVYKIQKAVNKCLVEGSGAPFFEDETIGRLCDFAAESGANPNRIKKRHSVLVFGDPARPSLRGIFPALQLLPGDWDDGGQDMDDDELEDRVAAIAMKEKLAAPPSSKYFVTVSRRTALRRLHMAGCFVKPDRCGEVIFLDEVCQDDFDSMCQACQKRMMMLVRQRTIRDVIVNGIVLLHCFSIHSAKRTD